VAHDVFISYSDHDRGIADAVCTALEANGIRCWIDHRDVLPGANWGHSIECAICDSRILVLVLSSYANDSKYVPGEVQTAHEEGKQILPFRIDGVKLSGVLRLLLSSIECVKAVTLPMEQHMERLCRAASAMIGTKTTDETTLLARSKVRLGTAAALCVPTGFRPVRDAGFEPYTSTGMPREIIHDKTGIEMVFIPAGEFTMGSPPSESESFPDEQPAHMVRITRPFYFGKHEVTQAQWHKIMENNPSHFNGVSQPVETVSWNDCREFLGKAGDGLRLPTEAEWEYACRAGSTTIYSFGDRRSCLADHAWYKANSSDATHSVGRKKANAWGLYDMHGNVWEWCADWYHSEYYAGSPVNDPPGPSVGKKRVVRGGGWDQGARYCRAATRADNKATALYINNGLRVAKSLQ